MLFWHCHALMHPVEFNVTFLVISMVASALELWIFELIPSFQSSSALLSHAHHIATHTSPTDTVLPRIVYLYPLLLCSHRSHIAPHTSPHCIIIKNHVTLINHSSSTLFISWAKSFYCDVTALQCLLEHTLQIFTVLCSCATLLSLIIRDIHIVCVTFFRS